MKTTCLASLVLGALALATASVQAGVSFPDPSGGWTYIFNGDKDTYGGAGSGFTSLDGTWSFENGSSQWDGSKIGGVIGPDNAPGGVMTLTEGNVTFLRIQDPGDPRQYGFPDPSNRKIYFGHNMTAEGATDTIIDDGVTLSFRTRLPTNAPIDQLYPDGQAAKGPQPYPAAGDGNKNNNSGKGNFVIKQNAGGEIAFSLTTTNDTTGGDPNGAKANFAGLTMNALNGNQIAANVDFGQGTFTNQIPLDPTQWHEFWIVLRKDPANIGTHEAFLFVDGNLTPFTFKMTTGNGSDYSAMSYLAMGSPQTSQSAAQDVDFFAYKIGAVFPPGVSLLVGSASATPFGVSISVNDIGPSIADTNTIALKLDGTVVKPTSVAKQGSVTTIAYTTSNLLASASSHVVSLTIKDTQTPPNVVSVDRQVAVAPYATLPATLALTSAQVDTSKAGFIWDMSQVASVGSYTQNSTRRTLDQLAGLLGPNIADPNAQGVATAAGTPGPAPEDPIRFEIPTLLVLDRNGATWSTWGTQAVGDQMPGSPGTSAGTDNQAARAVAYVDLPAGLITMGVNSDDGFLTQAGFYNDVFSLIPIPGAEYNGGRGAGDSTFTFFVAKPGIYPFVTYWENGGGDSRIAWFTVMPDGSHVAINDTAAGGLKAYRALVAGAQKAGVTSATPAPDATGVAPNASLRLTLADGSNPIDKGTVSLKLDRTTVAASITKTGSVTTVLYTPSGLFASASTHAATLAYTEAGSPVSRDWQFTVVAYTPTLDKLHKYAGLVLGSAKFTADKGGHSGNAGDYGIDLTSQPGWVNIIDASFLNPATTNDELSFAMWIKKYDIANGSAFWAIAPSVGGRGFQAHTPWSDDVVYFDTSGCCDTTTQRISANINTFSGYTGNDGWWTNWHHFVFTKKLADKNIYIDGKSFLSSPSTAALATDFTQIALGTDGNPGGDYMHGVIDDFAVFSNALTLADAAALAGGASPTSLSTAKLLAYWDFNDAPPPPATAGPKLSVAKSGNSVTLTWPTTAAFALQSASSLAKPITWTPVSQTPTTSGNTSSVTLPIGTANQFFQLTK